MIPPDILSLQPVRGFQVLVGLLPLPGPRFRLLWFPYPSKVPGYLRWNMEKLTGILKHQSSITATAPENGCMHSMLRLNLLIQLILLEVHHCSGVEAAKSFELLPWKLETSDFFMWEVEALKNQLSTTTHDLCFLRIYGVGGWRSNLSSGSDLMYLYMNLAFVAVALRRIRRIRQLLATSEVRVSILAPPRFQMRQEVWFHQRFCLQQCESRSTRKQKNKTNETVETRIFSLIKRLFFFHFLCQGGRSWLILDPAPVELSSLSVPWPRSLGFPSIFHMFFPCLVWITRICNVAIKDIKRGS